MSREHVQGEYFVSLAPHIRAGDTTQKIMRDVLIALVPAGLASVYYFGLRSLLLIAVTVASCVASEYIFQKLTKRPVRIGDLSAVLTGLLLAYNLPPTAPVWMAIFGAVFSIIIVKECFGGIGSNFMNPALAGRVMLMASWPALMTDYIAPTAKAIAHAAGDAAAAATTAATSGATDAVAYATPLAIIKESGDVSRLPSMMDMFLGNIGGVLGETCAAALLLGGIYLIVRRVIDWKVPVIYFVSTAVFLLIFGVDAKLLGYELLGGGLFLGAFFMATDYASSPINARGKIIFALGCGLITALIRAKGGMPEGVSYSILVMNMCAPLIDRLTKTKAYGPQKA